MKKVELEKHKFDQKTRLIVFFSLLLFAGFLQVVHSSTSGEVVTLVIGLAGGSTFDKGL